MDSSNRKLIAKNGKFLNFIYYLISQSTTHNLIQKNKKGKPIVIKPKDECVRVIIRCRPMEQKEKDRNCEQVVIMDAKRGLVSIKNPKSNEEKKEFTFDSVYDWK